MLKGTTTIELKDEITGEIDTFSDENMVTNALAELFRPLGLAKNPSEFLQALAPYYETLLGGLLCFDSRIDENPNDFFPPSSATQVACGQYNITNTGIGTQLGNFNAVESEITPENGLIKFVWDFPTSVGNGTINSVCLTHIRGGAGGYGSEGLVYTGYATSYSICDKQLQYVRTSGTGAKTSDKQSGYTVGTTEQIFLISREEDVVYYLRIDSEDKIAIVTRRAYLRSVSIFDDVTTTKALVDTIEITLDEPLISSTNVTYNFDTADQCLYLMTATSTTTAANGVFQVIKIEFPSWKVTNYSATNTTGVTIGTSRANRFAYVHEGYVLVKANASPYTIYKLEIDNWANVTEFTYTDSTILNSYPAYATNGRVYFRTNSSGQCAIANLETNEVLRQGTNASYGSNTGAHTPVLDEPIMFYLSQGTSTDSWYCMKTNYLATINNLGETVTKTADKTMKITYLIREEL